MPAGGNKTLFLRNMPTELVREAKAAAARRGETLTTIVARALSSSLRVDNDMPDRADPLQRDMAWYRKHQAKLLAQYRGQYIAIVDQAIVDHGPDFAPLAARLFRRLGNRSVYMPRVQAGEPTARIRSPRLSRP